MLGWSDRSEVRQGSRCRNKFTEADVWGGVVGAVGWTWLRHHGRGLPFLHLSSGPSLLQHKECNLSLSCRRCLHCYVYPLRGTQDPVPRLCCCCLSLPPLSLPPLPSLLSNCRNLPIATQGRSWRLNEAHFLKTRNGGHGKAFVPRSPTAPGSVLERLIELLALHFCACSVPSSAISSNRLQTPTKQLTRLQSINSSAATLGQLGVQQNEEHSIRFSNFSES